VTGSRSLAVLSRVLLLVVAAGAAMSGALIALHDATPREAGARWVCPMHPDIRAAVPGTCPICGMALERAGGAAVAASRRGMPDELDFAAVENVRRHNIVAFVRKRSLLFTEQELRAPATVDADGTIAAIFYDDQIAVLRAGEPGTFTPGDAPAAAVPVRRIDRPVTRADASTSRVAFRPASADPALRTGRAGWLEVAPRPRQVLAVPASAVLQAPEGPYVLAATGGFAFEKRPIRVGENFQKQGFVVVLDGLRPNERVVARAAFFLDADRRAGVAGWAAP